MTPLATPLPKKKERQKRKMAPNQGGTAWYPAVCQTFIYTSQNTKIKQNIAKSNLKKMFTFAKLKAESPYSFRYWHRITFKSDSSHALPPPIISRSDPMG